jgi:centrosomal protein CEP76
LIPPLNESVSDSILAAQLDLEHTKSTERERLFLIYAKQWWKEYLEIREEHRTRLVKIFGQVKHDKRDFIDVHCSIRLMTG